MSNCRFCGKSLKESQYIEINGIKYKSCPKCSQNNPNNEHVYYQLEAFGFTIKSKTNNNPDGIQSLCSKCRAKNKTGPHDNAIFCSTIDNAESESSLQTLKLYEGLSQERTILQENMKNYTISHHL